MKVTVFGANGRVGSKVVQKLLNDGHTVRAFIHSSSRLGEHQRLEVIEGDIHDAQAVAHALRGADGVISVLGSWGTESKDILVSGMKAILPAMKNENITRIVSLTGAGARDYMDKPNALDRISRWSIQLIARKIFADGENHIKLLRDSKLDWTVVRSPAMRESSKRLGFILSKHAPSPWATIVRDEVANAIVELVTNKEWRQASPYIRQR